MTNPSQSIDDAGIPSEVERSARKRSAEVGSSSPLHAASPATTAPAPAASDVATASGAISGAADDVVRADPAPPSTSRVKNGNGRPTLRAAGGDVDRRSVAVLGDRVLISPPTDAERRSKGGILIPATAASIDRKGIWGEVVGVGPHVRHVNIGDEVLYLPEDAIEVDVQGDAYLIVRERDIHAVGSARSDGATGLYL